MRLVALIRLRTHLHSLQRVIERLPFQQRQRRHDVADDNTSNKQREITLRILQYMWSKRPRPKITWYSRSVKESYICTVWKVMTALLREQVHDDEELATLMCEVESIVNGRPLTKVSDDPRDLETLTPNHLLLPRSGSTLPRGIFRKDLYSHWRWHQIQYLSDVFAKRGSRSIFPVYKNNRSGQDQQVTLQLETLYSW